MAEQSLLGKLGLRLGILGSSASLAIAAPLAAGNYDPTCHTDAARTGWYFDRTAGAEKIGMMVGGIAGPLYTRSGTSVNMTLATPTPSLVIGDGTGAASYVLDGASGNNRFYYYQTAGVNRWSVGLNNTAESGSDSGSDFVLNSYSDAGAYNDTPLSIIRAANGLITLARPVFLGAGTVTNAAGTIIWTNSATWNNAAIAFTAFNINITDTNSAAASTLMLLQISSVTRWSIRKDGLITAASVDDLTGPQCLFSRSFTLTGNVTSTVQVTLTAALAGAFTITRYNYLNLSNPTGAATITNGCVMRFNAAAGTHKAIDAGTTKTTPTGVDAWMKININGTLYFKPLYLSKTA